MLLDMVKRTTVAKDVTRWQCSSVVYSVLTQWTMPKHRALHGYSRRVRWEYPRRWDGRTERRYRQGTCWGPWRIPPLQKLDEEDGRRQEKPQRIEDQLRRVYKKLVELFHDPSPSARSDTLHITSHKLAAEINIGVRVDIPRM